MIKKIKVDLVTLPFKKYKQLRSHNFLEQSQDIRKKIKIVLAKAVMEINNPKKMSLKFSNCRQKISK